MTDLDVEFEKAMAYTRAILTPLCTIARLFPGGQAAIDRALAKIVPETERQYRELLFREKLDAKERARGEVLLARFRTEIAAYAKEQSGQPGCDCGTANIGETHSCGVMPTCGGEDMHPLEPEPDDT